MRRALVLTLCMGCQSAAPAGPAPPSAPSTPARRAPETAASSPPSSASSGPSGPAFGAPLTGPPRLVVENHSSVDLGLYGAYLVDERGELGTLALWPDKSDCPGDASNERVVPRGRTLELPAPTRTYDSERCAPGPALAPGRYVLRLETGYTNDLYAAATIVLPLSEPVRLSIVSHADEPFACDDVIAMRAARLAFAAAAALPGLPSDLLSGCDPARARCGTLPLDEAPPPTTCTVTLHEDLLRVDRPAGNDALRGLTAWTDRAVVWVREPDVTRTSASVVTIAGRTVIVEGQTRHHLHEHGGDAASIGHMTVRVHNPLDRELDYSVREVAWLVDGECGLPSEVRARPRVLDASPAKIAPGTTEVEIAFAPQGAYQAHCDRFASRATLDVEGHRVIVATEHEVTRFEPLRR